MMKMMNNCCLPCRLTTCVILMLVFQASVKGHQQCKEKVADVVFLLDSSFSIWESDFAKQLQFLQDLVDSFTIGSNNIRVGVATFSTEVRLDVALNEYKEKQELKDAIGQIEYMQGGTRTDQAIRFAHSTMFTPAKGSRPWAAHIAILITDGYSYDTNMTTMEASIARSKGIEMFAIGVGGGADGPELRAIASDPDESHVFHVQNYEALKDIEETVAKRACRKPNATEPTTEDKDVPEDTHEAATERCGGKPADIYFLLDSSSSIWSVHFQEELRFVQQLLHLFDLGPDRTRVGVAVFSEGVREVVALSDQQNGHSIREKLLTAPYLMGNTHTGEAIQYVRTQAFAKARPDVAHVIIVLTDGQSVNRTHTLQEAQRVHEEGMYMFAVGIGSSTDVDELMTLASNPDENFMFHVDNFAGLTSIRDLLAIKTCDVETPDYQGDQAQPDCHISKPTDVLFLYDSASVSRRENDVISEVIRNMVQKMESDPDTLRFGLLRQNCHKGDNIDLKTGVKAPVLQTLLEKPHHHGLHTLLKKARLHGYIDAYDYRRSRTRKVIVLFVSAEMVNPEAVEREIQLMKFQGVQLLVVAVGKARDHMDMLGSLSSVQPFEIGSHSKLLESGDLVFDKFCELNRKQDW